MVLELHFSFTGATLPSDQGYALYSAISRLIPEAHEADWLSVETIAGIARGDGVTQLDPESSLKVRLPQDRVPLLLKLAGKRLELNGHVIRLGAPQIFLLKAWPQLYARIVTIKGFTEPEPFLEAVFRKMDEMGVKGEPEVGPRRILKVGNHTIVGFSLAVHELGDEASITLQERGIGGRRRMGCGIFSRSCWAELLAIARSDIGSVIVASNQPVQRLLAKSRRPGREDMTLQMHSLDTAEAAELIFNLEKRWGRNWCRFFGIQLEGRSCFLLNLKVAALFHDLGKANEDFYHAVTRVPSPRQTLRHEHISALILFLPEVREWLARNPMLDLDVIAAAVLSHHLKASAVRDAERYGWCAPREKTTLKLYLQHDEVKAILRKVGEIGHLGQDIPNLPANQWGMHSPFLEAWESGRNAARSFGRSVGKDRKRLSLLLAVKAGLIAADSVSSGLWREGHSIEDWVNSVVHTAPTSQAALAEAILNPRVAQLRRMKPDFVYRDFQMQIAEEGARVLLVAACAAGKTLAAWKWAEAQVGQYEIGKVIFLYPTRGTATEGFRDYVGWAPEAEAALDHGTAGYELEAMQENPSDALKGKVLGRSEADERLYALGLWGRRYLSATVDQFLGFMEYQYNSMCKVPMLSDCALIIDEVHSFDQRMFNTLLAFLKTFDLPVLCMTATLSPRRQDDLKAAGLRLYRADNDIALKKLEEFPRYRLEPVSDEDEALAKAASAYRSGHRVLWVVNTVKRCQSLANRLADELGDEVISYHSRFKLTDRQTIHSRTVAAFQQEGSPTIAVTTQVCEMSLDLDADVLLTEIAPVSSLVQRFGRANRHLKRKFAVLHTYKPENEKPYFKDDMEMAQKFLAAIGVGCVSQAKLAELLETHSILERAGDDTASFLESGYFATTGEFRDTDDFALPCVLDNEVEKVIGMIKQNRPYDGLIVNVPKGLIDLKAERPSGLPRHLFVADSKRYSERRGFLSE